jgi:hypothetical protein
LGGLALKLKFFSPRGVREAFGAYLIIINVGGGGGSSSSSSSALAGSWTAIRRYAPKIRIATCK